MRPALPFMYGKLKAPFLAGIALSALNGAREADQARPFEGAFGMAMAGGGGEGGTDAGGGVTGAPSIDTSTAHPARVYDYWPSLGKYVSRKSLRNLPAGSSERARARKSSQRG